MSIQSLRRARVDSNLAVSTRRMLQGEALARQGAGLAGQGSYTCTASSMPHNNPGERSRLDRQPLVHLHAARSAHLHTEPTCRSSSVRIFVAPDGARLMDICSQQGSIEGLL